MNQTIHILRKDIRYLWSEILASLTIAVLFTYFDPQSWPASEVPGATFEALPAYLLAGLWCISWGLLIIRLVQAERMVGLNQFWTTRPYEWPKLLAAKLLFVLLTIFLPLTLSQLFLLHHAGLPLAGSMPLLLLNLLLLTGATVLPTISIAAITASFAKAFMVLLGYVVVLVVFLASGLQFSRDFTPRFLTPLQIVVELAMLSALLLHQYRRRATRSSIYFLVLTAIVFVSLQLLVRGRSLAVLGYTPPTQPPPISIQFDPNPYRISGALPQDPKNPQPVYLWAPLSIVGINLGASFNIEAQRLTLVGADGYRWQSHWQNGFGPIFSPPTASAPSHAFSVIEIPRQVYNRLTSTHGPVSLVSFSMDFALTQMEDQSPLTSTLSTAGNEVPGVGFCYLADDYGSVRCRSAFRQPNRFASSTFRNEGVLGPCAASPPILDAVRTFLEGPLGLPQFLHISPVQETPLRLSPPSKPSSLCPGTPITFVPTLAKASIQIQMPPVTLNLKRYGG